MKSKEKRKYERPQMQVVELKELPQLLQASANTDMDILYEEEDI